MHLNTLHVQVQVHKTYIHIGYSPNLSLLDVLETEGCCAIIPQFLKANVPTGRAPGRGSFSPVATFKLCT